MAYSKGQLITMNLDGTDREYRILKLDGNIAEVVCMSSVGKTTFGSNSTYAGSSLDTYLNSTWYDKLTAEAKAAIVSKTFNQDSWYWGTSGSPVYSGNYGDTVPGTSPYSISKGSDTYGDQITRSVYALSVQDVLDYVMDTGVGDGKLENYNIWKMFWNMTTQPSVEYPWLRSADGEAASIAWGVGFSDGDVVRLQVDNNVSVRPALTIDLLKIFPPQLDTPQNVTASGTVVSFDPVENATSYAVLADGNEIGTVDYAIEQLEIPQNIQVIGGGTTVSWDAVENATSYDVYADDTTLLGSVALQSSVDLATLSGWADLTDGNHIIKIVAKADGYQDSEKSAGVEVTKSASPKTLEQSTWAEIAQVSANKSWDAMGWQVGDSKTITLNGTVGTLALDNYQCKVYIIGFDHNAEKEGQGISFGMLEGMDGKQLCLVDQYVGQATVEVMAFTMNKTDTNEGGWRASKMRNTILGSTDVANPAANTLMAALPADLRAVLKPITKYTNNVGKSSDVSSTIDYLPLMAEFEVYGRQNFANPNEKTYQAQYEYYKNGNSKAKYKQNDVASAAYWWLRSPSFEFRADFCLVDKAMDGKYSLTSISNGSSGVAPVFLV